MPFHLQFHRNSHCLLRYQKGVPVPRDKRGLILYVVRGEYSKAIRILKKRQRQSVP